MKITILLLTLILTGCNSNSQNDNIILKGKLGEFDAQMALKKDGDFFNGLFTYETVNDKQIKLKGQIENNQLRISEFNAENEITGLFLGKYSESGYIGEWSDVNGKAKVPFLFRKSKTLLNSNEDKKQGVTELNSKELLETYFEAKEYITDSIARYKVGNELSAIEFHKLENYSLDDKQYSIAIFDHYPLYNYDELGFGRGITTASIGDSKFSVIKFVKNEGNWILVEQFDNLDIGTNIRGDIYLPQIKQIENFTFLELPDIVYYASGSFNRSTKIFNIKNFKESLEISAGGYQAGEVDIDEFIEEMNIDKYNSKGEVLGIEEPYSVSLWSTSKSKYRLNIQNDKLLCIVDFVSGHFDEIKKKFIKEETSTIYSYNENTLEFEELK